MQLQRRDAVSTEAAYRAAEDRALRATRALIMAEARVIELASLLAAARAVADAKEEEIVRLGGRATEGGGEGGPDAYPVGYTDAVGQAD